MQNRPEVPADQRKLLGPIENPDISAAYDAATIAKLLHSAELIGHSRYDEAVWAEVISRANEIVSDVQASATPGRDTAIPNLAQYLLASGDLESSGDLGQIMDRLMKVALPGGVTDCRSAGERNGKNRIAVCDRETGKAAGLRRLIEGCPEWEWAGAVDSLNAATALGRRQRLDIVILSKEFGMRAVLEWTTQVKLFPRVVAVVIRAQSLSVIEALRLYRAGARGSIRESAGGTALRACLSAVADGRMWMEAALFRDAVPAVGLVPGELSNREQEVAKRIKQGLPNREIARELGICPGTVRIHVKRILAKHGIRRRYGLAIAGFQQENQGLVSERRVAPAEALEA